VDRRLPLARSDHVLGQIADFLVKRLEPHPDEGEALDPAEEVSPPHHRHVILKAAGAHQEVRRARQGACEEGCPSS
jgi:hypothetical protein